MKSVAGSANGCVNAQHGIMSFFRPLFAFAFIFSFISFLFFNFIFLGICLKHLTQITKYKKTTKINTVHFFSFLSLFNNEKQQKFRLSLAHRMAVALAREERLRQIKDQQNLERQRKLDELKAQAIAAQKYREQKEEERKRRIDDMRVRENDKRQQVTQPSHMYNSTKAYQTQMKRAIEK